MPKIVNTALKAKATGPEAKAKAKAIKFGLEAPRGQGLASRTTSLWKTEHFRGKYRHGSKGVTEAEAQSPITIITHPAFIGLDVLRPNYCKLSAE